MSASSGQAAGSSRKRLTIGAVACLAVTGAIVAGVVGARQHRHKASGSSSTLTTTSVNSPDPYAALHQANTSPPPSTSDLASATSPAPDVAAAAPATGSPVLDTASTAATTPSSSAVAPATPERTGPLDSLLNSLGFGNGNAMVNDSSLATVGTWKALKGANHFLCYPADGPEFIRMATSPQCTVIYLRSDLQYGYVIKDQINITDTKIIVGNPIAMPKLNSTRPAPRLFDVYPGAVMDIRFVHMYRGFGRSYQGGNLRVISGGTIRAHPAAHVVVSGCVFDQAAQTFQAWLNDLQASPRVRARAYGGHVLVLGGNLFLLGCSFVGFSPYGTPVWNAFNIGGQVAVIMGNVVSTGTWHTGFNLYQNFFALGNNIAVLGGTYVWVGGGLVTANGAQAQWAAGAVIFVGGGVLIGVGIEFITTTGALVRAAMGEWTVGAGVKIFIGFTYVRAYAVAQQFGAGALQAVGAGISRIMSGSQSTVAIAQSFMGAGGTNFCGTGSMVYFANPRVGVVDSQANFGLGMNIYNGAGLMGMNWSPSAAFNVVRLTSGCATESCLLAGWGLFLNSTRWSYQVINVFYGIGNTIYVGAGGGIIYRNLIISQRVINYSRVPFAVQITGVGLTGGQAGQSLIIFDNQSYPFNLSHTQHYWLDGGFDRAKKNNDNNNDNDDNEDDDNKDKNHHNDRLYRRLSVLRNLKKKGSKSADKDLTTALDNALESNDTDPAGTLIYVNNVIDERLIEAKKLDLSTLPAIPTFSDVADLLSRASKPDKPYEVFVPKHSKQCYMCGCNDGSCGDHVKNGVCEASDQCKASTVKAQLATAKKNGFPMPLSMVPSPERMLADDDDTTTVAEEQQQQPAPAQNTHAHAILRLMNIKEEAKLNVHDADVPDTTLMWHELVVYCKNSSLACADEATVKDALYDFLDQVPSADYSLTVADQALHPAIAKVATEELYNSMAPEEHPECRGWTKFNVYATAHDEVMVKEANDKWEAAQADPSQLLQHLQSKLSTELCQLSVKTKTVTTYPRMENMPAYNPHNAGFVGPSLTVVASDSIAPLAELVAGKTYQIHVQNFPHASTVLVKLRRGVGGDKDDVATIANFDDSKTVATVDWTVPADAQGTCYLVAYPEKDPLLFTFSNAFDVVNAPTRPKRRW